MNTLRNKLNPSGWITASAIGWLAGAAVTEALGSMVASTQSEGSSVLALVMIAAGVLEGAVIGAAQWMVVRKVVGPRWIAATAAGVGLGWIVGALGSSLEPPDTSFAMTLFVAIAFGALMGLFVAFFQSRLARARGYLLWTAMAWSCAFAVRAIAQDLVPWGPSSWRSIAINLGGALVAGVVLGIVTMSVAKELEAVE